MKACLIWLEADALLRQKTAGRRGMDDFARTFFAAREGEWKAKPFDLAEVIRTLDGIASHDWKGFLESRLTGKAAGAPSTASSWAATGWHGAKRPARSFAMQTGAPRKPISCFSLGGVLSGNEVRQVVWDGPLFNAGLTVGNTIIAVNGTAYSEDALLEAIRAAKGGSDPIRLIVKAGRRVSEVPVQWNGGLRYPRLERTGSGEGSLDLLLKPKP